MSNYLIELSAIHIALMLGYWLFLRKERQYAKMRIYLIASTLLALIIALLKLPRLLFNSNESVGAIPMGIISVDAVTITPSEALPSAQSSPSAQDKPFEGPY